MLSGGVTWDALGLMSAKTPNLSRIGIFGPDVSRIFQVPSFMLADSGRATYATARELARHFAMMCSQPWVTKLQRAFHQSVLTTQFRLVIDLSDLLRADPEARWATWQRARQAGVLSPNDIRAEEDWPASTDPTADSILPPNTSAAAVVYSPPADSGKVVDIGQHRHAGDAPPSADPEFAPIKARLARLYLVHKADIGVPAASDELIVSHIDDITALLMRGVAQAIATNNVAFLIRYRWFVEVTLDDLTADRPGKRWMPKDVLLTLAMR